MLWIPAIHFFILYYEVQVVDLGDNLCAYS